MESPGHSRQDEANRESTDSDSDLEAVKCPECMKQNKRRKLNFIQVSFTTATYLCPDIYCPYPKDGKFDIYPRKVEGLVESDEDTDTDDTGDTGDTGGSGETWEQEYIQSKRELRRMVGNAAKRSKRNERKIIKTVKWPDVLRMSATMRKDFMDLFKDKTRVCPEGLKKTFAIWNKEFDDNVLDKIITDVEKASRKAQRHKKRHWRRRMSRGHRSRRRKQHSNSKK